MYTVDELVNKIKTLKAQTDDATKEVDRLNKTPPLQAKHLEALM